MRAIRAIDGYVLRQVLLGAGFITGGLTFAVWLTQSLRFIDYIVNKGLPFGSFVALVGLMLPAFVAVVMPVALFVATLCVYNKLVMDSEMIVLRAAGVSQWGLAKPPLMAAGSVAVIGYVLTLYLSPLAYGGFKQWQFEVRNNYSGLILREGQFNELVRGVTAYVRERAGSQELHGILIHDGRDPERPTPLMAESGVLLTGEDGPRVILVNGNRQEVDAGDGQLAMLYFERYTVDLTSEASTPANRWRDIRERSIFELMNPRQSLTAQWAEQEPELFEKRANTFRAEGHQRLVSPLYAITFALIAVAALLGGQFTRRGQTRALAGAAIAVVALQIAALGWQNLTAKVPDLWPLIYANALVPAALAMVIMTRRPRRRERLADPGLIPAAAGD